MTNVLCRLLGSLSFSDQVRRTVHRSFVNSCQVLANQPYSHQLNTRKNGYQRGQKGKARHWIGGHQAYRDDIDEYQQAKECESESDQARYSQRQRRIPSQEIKSML